MIARRTTLTLVALPLLVLTSCDKLPLFAPTESTITLFAIRRTLPVNGTTEIIATVIEQAGTPVQNGTLVIFRTTLGTVDPPEVRTKDGKATARFTAGTRSGTAVLNAVSGSATSDDIEILVGGAAAERIDLSANPPTVSSSGGAVQIVAIVTDANGNRLPGVPVTFTSDAGTLSVVTVVTDDNGEARTTLTTNRETLVTARAGGKEATRTIRVHQLPTVAVTADTTNPVENEPVTFTITVTPAAGGTAIRNVTVDYGDGTFPESLGTISGTIRTAHTYRSPGSYRVTVTVTDAAGERQTASTVVNVARVPPINVTLAASSSTPQVAQPVTFTATVTPATAQIREYQWNFGDGATRTTAGNTTNHIYGTPGHRVVTVTVIPVSGSSARAQIEVIVQPAPPAPPGT